MCYHISQRKIDIGRGENPPTEADYIQNLESSFDAYFDNPEVFKPAYHLNGFDHGYLYGITQEANTLFEPMKWGFVEMQSDEVEYWDGRIQDVEDIDQYWRKKGGYTLNGTIEKVFDYYLTAEAIRKRRCVIPITGFFESQHVGKSKYPYFIHPKDGSYLALAGIYNNTGGLLTCKILTAPANPLMSEIHNTKKRQPVMLHPNKWRNYLYSGLTDDEVREILLTDTSQELEAYTVSKDVTNSRIKSNTSKALERVHYDELNTLF